MSYQVIALKWRPKTFDRMIGQKHIGQTLINALKNERLPQALLFTGPRGTGKTSAARILAKSLRCLNSKDFNPCGLCSECLDISSGRSLDVVEIDGASNNGVDSIRELRESVSFRPTVGSKKIYIIDEVHMLSLSAFNALLKTLEEPPDHVMFILATTEVHKIPKTILSRCHRFDFRRVSTKEVTEHLEFICGEEDVKFEKEALWAIARQGEGSVRDAFSFLDQVITYSGKDITYETVIESLGLTDRRLLTTILSDIVNTDTESLLLHMEDIFKSGADVGVFAEDFLEQIKNLLIVKSAKKPEDFLDLPQSEIQILKDISVNIFEGHIHLLFDMMLEMSQSLMRTQDQRTVLEVGLLKLCLYPKVLDLKPVYNTVQNLGSNSAPLNSKPVINTSSINNSNTHQNSSAVQSSRPALNRPNPIATMATKSESPSSEIQNYAYTNSSTRSIEGSKTENAVFKSANQPMSQATSQPTHQPKVPSSYQEEKDNQVGLSEDQKKWHDFVAKVTRLNAKMGATIQNCLYEVKNQNVSLVAPDKLVFIKKDLEKPEFQKVLSNYIKTFLGPDFILKIKIEGVVATEIMSDKTAVKEQEDMTAEEKRRLIENIHNSEAVQKLKQTFKDIEIVAIKEMKS